MGLIQLWFKACYAVKYHIIPKAADILLQLIVYDRH